MDEKEYKVFITCRHHQAPEVDRFIESLADAGVDVRVETSPVYSLCQTLRRHTGGTWGDLSNIRQVSIDAYFSAVHYWLDHHLSENKFEQAMRAAEEGLKGKTYQVMQTLRSTHSHPYDDDLHFSGIRYLTYRLPGSGMEIGTMMPYSSSFARRIELKGNSQPHASASSKAAQPLRIEFDESMSEEDQKQYLALFAQATKELTGKDVEFTEPSEG
jgi:hypothetical protein